MWPETHNIQDIYANCVLYVFPEICNSFNFIEETSFKPITPASGRLLDKIDMTDVVETDEDAEDNDKVRVYC